MPWLRRTAGVLAGLTLFPTLFAALVLLRLDETFLSPSFYADQLRKADVYRFVMVDVLASAIEDARELEMGSGENPLALSGLTTPQVVDAVNRALPPESLEDLIAPAALQVGEYVSANRGEFTVTILVGEYAKDMLGELPKLMSEAGTYHLLLERELKPRIREAISSDENMPNWAAYLFESSDDAADRLTQAVMHALTSEWAHSQVETALGKSIPYLLGESDGFEIRIVVTDTEADALVREAKSILREAAIYDKLFEREVEPRIQDAVDHAMASNRQVPRWTMQLFGDGEEAAARLNQAVRRIAPPEWVQAQAEAAIEEAAPYMFGRADGFEIRVQVTDSQVEAATEEIKTILREADAYDLIYRDVIEPVVRERVGAKVVLPYGVEISNDEVVDVLRQSAPPTWVQQEAEMLIDHVGPYVAGQARGFATEVSLVDNKRRAERAFVEVVDERLTGMVLDLPGCRSSTVAAVAAMLKTALPTCIPPGKSASDIIEQTRTEVVSAIRPLVLSPVPNRVIFTDANLRSGLVRAGAGDALDLLDDARRLAEGWEYDSDDLRAGLGEDVKALDQARALLADGYTYTHGSLRVDLDRYSGDAVRILDDVRALLARGYVYTHEYGSRNQALSDLDDVHSRAVTVRRYGWLAYVLVPFLIVATGLLGGAMWPTRILWSSAFLLVSSVAAFVVAGPFYDFIFAPGFERLHATVMAQSSSDFTHTFALISDKLHEVLGAFRSEFVGGVQRASLVAIAIALACLAPASFFLYLSRPRRQQPT